MRRLPSISSPGIRYLGRLFHSTKVGIEVVLGGRELAISREGGRHSSRVGLVKTEDMLGQCPKPFKLPIALISNACLVISTSVGESLVARQAGSRVVPSQRRAEIYPIGRKFFGVF